MTTTTRDSLPANAIAVVGMAGRFPGAESVSAFWNNLRSGEESITTLSVEALTAAGITPDVLANPAYVRRAPLLAGVDEFDADFFGFTPQAARTKRIAETRSLASRPSRTLPARGVTSRSAVSFAASNDMRELARGCRPSRLSNVGPLSMSARPVRRLCRAST